jgi:predicted nuclease of predicted toxin-antitoxin system
LKESRVKLRVLLDEGVPIDVADVLRQHSHEAILAKDVVKPGSVDEIVWKAAIANDAIFMAYDKDVTVLRRHSQRDDRFEKLHMISFRKLPEPMAAKRLKGAMSFVENEWRFCCEKSARRMALEIYKHHLRTFR